MKVHSRLGAGFHEAVYKDAMEIEFSQMEIPYARERNFQIVYEGEVLKHSFTVDFLVYDSLVVEIKAVSELIDIHKAQTLNYLKATNAAVGLVINFGELDLKFKRIICSENM